MSEFISKSDGRQYNNEYNLGNLKRLVGNYAYYALRTGKATLNIWRGTCPYNIYVEGKRSTLWHSEYGEGPSLYLFEEIDSSKDIINHSTLHRDGGRPFLTRYRLKKNF